jgi:hypothetical protein
MMAELNSFPWDKVESIYKYTGTIDREEMLTEHLKSLELYETEVMERLRKVRSEIEDAKQYLKV